jgi:uncharacterized membrane protein YgdD (TMEM256/DUF423 family)
LSRWLVAAGALLAGASVALSAYAAHSVPESARGSLQSAALLAMLHGIALAALGRGAAGAVSLPALWLLLAGTLLFSGSLACGHFCSTSTRLAPFGGTLLIVGWLAYAVAALARR